MINYYCRQSYVLTVIPFFKLSPNLARIEIKDGETARRKYTNISNWNKALSISEEQTKDTLIIIRYMTNSNTKT